MGIERNERWGLLVQETLDAQSLHRLDMLGSGSALPTPWVRRAGMDPGRAESRIAQESGAPRTRALAPLGTGEDRWQA